MADTRRCARCGANGPADWMHDTIAPGHDREWWCPECCPACWEPIRDLKAEAEMHEQDHRNEWEDHHEG